MFDQRNPSFQLMSRSKWEKDLSIQSHSIQYCMTNTITTTSTAKSRRNILLFSQQMAHSESYSPDYIICGSSKGTFGVQEELIRHYSWNRNYQIWSWSIFIITFFSGDGDKNGIWHCRSFASDPVATEKLREDFPYCCITFLFCAGGN